LQRRTTPSSSSATTRRRPVEDGGLVLHEGDELFRLQTQREPFPPPSQHDPGDRQQHAGTGGRGDAAERAGRSSNTLAGSNPTLTSPTGETFAGRTPSAPGGQIGTFARAETPSVPLLPRDDLAAGEHLAEVGADRLAEEAGSGWASRMPWSSVITTNRVPVRAVTSAARSCSGASSLRRGVFRDRR
jgi:hypothetical protein